MKIRGLVIPSGGLVIPSGRIVFYTSDGNGTPTEAIRIDKLGHIHFPILDLPR